jgi:FMN-dependent NADH-azoreductase
MAKVLYIKANARPEGISRTYRISDSYIKAYRKIHPEDEIIALDLYKDGINFLPVGNLTDLHAPKQGK